jgi:hypothetical protein
LIDWTVVLTLGTPPDRSTPFQTNLNLALILANGSAGAGTARRGEDRVEKPREKIVEFLATKRIVTNYAVRFHPDDSGVAQDFKMTGGGGFAEVQGYLATVQSIVSGNGSDNL